MEYNRPQMIYLVDRNIASFSLTFPSGKKVILTPKQPIYTTDDKEEIAFASKQKGLFVKDVRKREYIKYLERKLEEVPTVTNPNFTKELAAKVKWSTKDEELLKLKLEELGYEVTYKDHAMLKVQDQKEEQEHKDELQKEEEEELEKIVEAVKKAPSKKAAPKKSTKKEK